MKEIFLDFDWVPQTVHYYVNRHCLGGFEFSGVLRVIVKYFNICHNFKPKSRVSPKVLI